MTNLSTPPIETTAPAPTSGLLRRARWLGPTGIVLAIGLSVVEWLVVRGPENDGTVAAALFALAMTLPVVLARRLPVPTAAILAVAAVVNGLVFPDLVRCAAAFPAAVYVAFAVGAWSRSDRRGWAWSVTGLLIGIGGVLAQYAWDPALHADPFFLVFGPAVLIAGWGAGIGWSLLVARRAVRRPR